MSKKNGDTECRKKCCRQLEHWKIPVYQPPGTQTDKRPMFQGRFIAQAKWFRWEQNAYRSWSIAVSGAMAEVTANEMTAAGDHGGQVARRRRPGQTELGRPTRPFPGMQIPSQTKLQFRVSQPLSLARLRSRLNAQIAADGTLEVKA
jgi:hypothetical protein